MSNSAFHHKDGKISIGIRCSLGIMLAHFNDEEGVSADSTKCAAQKLTEKLQKPNRLGRSHVRRCMKMQSAIEVAISRGLLRYSGRDCRLTLTREGRKVMKTHKRAKQTSRQLHYTNTVRQTATA